MMTRRTTPDVSTPADGGPEQRGPRSAGELYEAAQTLDRAGRVEDAIAA
jgi:hypothetical protein